MWTVTGIITCIQIWTGSINRRYNSIMESKNIISGIYIILNFVFFPTGLGYCSNISYNDVMSCRSIMDDMLQKISRKRQSEMKISEEVFDRS
jgi:hypothetical protein